MTQRDSKLTQADVIVIGAGISGLMSARELARAGARVILLERQGIGRESSWAGGGILSPLYPWRAAEPITALCRWSQAEYPRLAAELLESTGIDPEWLPSGLLVGDCEDIGRAMSWAETYGVRLETSLVGERQGLEPAIRIGPDSSLFLPDVGQIRNPRLLRALQKDLANRDVTLLDHHPVEQIKTEAGRVVGVVTRQGQFRAPQYVVTVGAWSGLITRDLGRGELPVMPAKGEMLVFKSEPGLLRHIVLSRGHYLIPRKDGRILAGSTLENVGFNKFPTEIGRETLLDFAYGIMPRLRQCEIEKHWAGLRPGSPLGIPTIGVHPKIDNLFFNCGHFRNGFVMAPASAHLLVDGILQRPPIVPPEPYFWRGDSKSL
ncbi:MAG: glycine oxidase ThiO [Methylococcaceae bacterium]|nr:glycine oxidase ThiO [Methylococcaceae bacterium]